MNASGLKPPSVGALAREIRPRDVRITGIIAAIQIGGTIAAAHHETHPHSCWWASHCGTAQHLDVGAIVLLAAGPVALLARRSYPRAVLLFVLTVTLAYVTLGYAQGPNYASLVVAFISVVIAGQRAVGGVALVAGWALFLCLPWALGKTGAPSLLASLAIGAWLIVLFAGAEGLRDRRERAAERRRVREQEARRRADEERLRIARELHDVLAHNISLINVQSGVALHLMDDRPEQARTALSAINEASADALREVRSVLSVLRGDGERAPRNPTPGLAQLSELVARAATANVDISLDVRGEQRPLPASVELAAFRIVQEAVTNVVRHASAASATVQVVYGADDLVLQIDDDGSGDADVSQAGGSGIAGMRERTRALRGELEAGPIATGGFRVRARLPVVSLGGEQ